MAKKLIQADMILHAKFVADPETRIITCKISGSIGTTDDDKMARFAEKDVVITDQIRNAVTNLMTSELTALRNQEGA